MHNFDSQVTIAGGNTITSNVLIFLYRFLTFLYLDGLDNCMDISLMPRNAHVALQELYADPDIGNSRSGVDIIKQKMEECSFPWLLRCL